MDRSAIRGDEGMPSLELRHQKRGRNRRFGGDSGTSDRRLRGAASVFLGLILLSAGSLTGCVTQGDFLRLQEKVAGNHMSEDGGPDPFSRIAKLSADVDAMRQEIRDLKGELEMANKAAADALEEVGRVRMALAAQGGSGIGGQTGTLDGDTGAVAGGISTGSESGGSVTQPDEELAGYQSALDAWRGDRFDDCIERFTVFLQTYPTSGYADDAAYWLADCTYKNDEFKRAVVRFNAVVSVYPESPKAPDALYRQGESLLKLGPKFHEAARTVFKRVQKDYPDSDRSVEA